LFCAELKHVAELIHRWGLLRRSTTLSLSVQEVQLFSTPKQLRHSRVHLWHWLLAFTKLPRTQERHPFAVSSLQEAQLEWQATQMVEWS
jgi:hypothetical protein